MDISVKTRILRLFLLSLLTLLAGCESDSDATPPAAPEAGLTAYIQAILHDDDSQATVGTMIFDTGRKISFVGGDMVSASNLTNEVVLRGAHNDYSFYQGNLDIESVSDGLNFTVEYLPIEARSERWYPADLAYVETGPGSYVGLNWHVNFPDRVFLDLPLSDTTYNYANDLVTIKWTNTSNSVDRMRVHAHLLCVDKVVELYNGPDIGQFTIEIQNMFATLNPENPDPVASALEDFTIGMFSTITKAATAGLVDLEAENEIKIEQCSIDLYALAEFSENIGPPFVSGNVIASRSISRQITFAPFEPLTL